MNIKRLKKQFCNYIQDESGALTIVELVLVIFAVLVIAGFAVAWIWGMISENTEAGTNANNNFNNIIDGIQ